MNQFRLKAVSALTCAVVVSLTACGGGGGGGTTAAATTTVTVSPSLGKFSAGAKVTLRSLSGILGTGTTTSAGTASINIGTYSGPLVVEVQGGLQADGVTPVKYYDERDGSSQNFGNTDFLRAIAPSVRANVGVTAATNAAVEAIKSVNSGTIPTTIPSADITLANNKIQTALGITDILVAPKLVGADTGTTLDIANVADIYALKLAALANLANAGKTALDVSNDLARDLSDGVLDRSFNTATGSELNTATSYTATTIAGDLSANLIKAATDFATTDSKNVITSDPKVLGVVETNVITVKAVTATTSTAIQLAKAMFAELRTTFATLLNTGETGFLNNQAKRISDDLKTAVAPNMDKVLNRLELVGSALKVHDAAKSGVSMGDVIAGTPRSLTDTGITGATWESRYGNLSNAWNGTGGFEYCYAVQADTTKKVTCFSAGRDAAGTVNLNGGNTVNLLRIELTPTATDGSFTYVATRENRPFEPTGQPGAATVVSGTACGTAGCIGTVSRTANAFTLAGTMPPSTLTTGVDTLALSATKTTLAAPNTFRLALTGSVETTAVTGGTTSKIALTTGSQIEADDTNKTTTGTAPIGIVLNGSIKTSATEFTGALSMSSFTKDKTGADNIPASLVFTGTAADLTPNGAGTFLTGKVEVTTRNFGNYDSTALQTSTNFVDSTVTFTGTIQAPTRPALKVSLSGTATGPGFSTLTASYGYGTVVINGSGSVSPIVGTTFKLTNQDGLEIAAIPNTSDRAITKSGTTVATITSGRVNYVDGSSESIQ